MLTAMQESGIALEKPVTYFLKKQFGEKRVKHNDFSPSKYPMGDGVDCEVKEKVLIECTNPKKTTSMNDGIMLKKIEYFTRRDPLHKLLWILIISFANFSQFIADKLKKMNIHLVILHIHADKNNFRALLRRFYHSKLIFLLKKFIQKVKPKKIKLPRNQVLLSSYIVSNNVVSSNSSNSIIVSKHLHLHQINPKLLSFITTVRQKQFRDPCGKG